MECVTANVLQVFTKIRQIVAFGWAAGYIKLKHFRDFLEISEFCSTTREATHTFSFW